MKQRAQSFCALTLLWNLGVFIEEKEQLLNSLSVRYEVGIMKYMYTSCLLKLVCKSKVNFKLEIASLTLPTKKFELSMHPKKI